MLLRLLAVMFSNNRNNVGITVMTAMHSAFLAKDINNNSLATLPVEKVKTKTSHYEGRVVQPGLISDLEEEVQHLIRFVALNGRTESGRPLWCFPGVIPVVTHFCLIGVGSG